MLYFSLDELKSKCYTIDQMYDNNTSDIPLHLKGHFAFSSTFQVLSTEGYRVARSILEKEYQRGFVKPDVRIQLCLR